MLARGGYCPKEHAQHAWLAAMQTEVEVGYFRLVTISTDSVLASKEWRQRLGAHLPFLVLTRQNQDARWVLDSEPQVTMARMGEAIVAAWRRREEVTSGR